jgi:hypothetical protein
LVLPETKDHGAQEVMTRVCDRVANDSQHPTISLSAGFAIYLRDGNTPVPVPCPKQSAVATHDRLLAPKAPTRSGHVARERPPGHCHWRLVPLRKTHWISSAEKLITIQVRSCHLSIYLTNMPFAEIYKKVARLGPESIGLFVTLARDGLGHPYMSAKAAGKIAAVFGAPVYDKVSMWLGAVILNGSTLF